MVNSLHFRRPRDFLVKTTVPDSSSIRGTGLFSARPSSLRFEPPPPSPVHSPSPPTNHRGLWIRRADAAPEHAVRICPDLIAPPPPTFNHACWLGPVASAIPNPRNTTLVLRDATPPSAAPLVAATVEHALSALAGMHIWDATIVLEGDEVPIDDGSALAFVAAARAALLDPSHSRAPFDPTGPLPSALILREAITVGDPAAAHVRAWPVAPGDIPTRTYDLDFGPGAPIAPTRVTWRMDADEYARAVAPARTFSLAHEAAAARAAGLFAHLTPAQMLVIGPGGTPIDNTFRMPDEPARHKLLDLLGDLALLGRPLHAHVHAVRSGHAMAHALVRALALTPANNQP